MTSHTCCVPAQHRDPAGSPAKEPRPVTGQPGDPGRERSIHLTGGAATVGTRHPVLREDGEGPQRNVSLAPFRIDAVAVSNQRFAGFSAATGYQTDAERFGWSFVFQHFVPENRPEERVDGAPWWQRVEGACWAAPEGPGSDIATRLDHPAVHISWTDAAAFATWANGRLPSEAEWEYAARGGVTEARFAWGEAEPDDGTAFCNIWQGRFPHTNTRADGYIGTAPVDSYAPNGFGLYNVCGNVWEWCGDKFKVRSLASTAKHRNQLAAAEQERVMKGGSYLCHRSYCYRYRIAARSGRSPNTSAGHTGFRVAYAAD
jgi:sulfatase modifying factor 1